MNKVAIYTRVSTNYQVDKDSLPLQRQDLINYAKCVLNTNNYEVFEDAGYSGKNMDRPGFKSMMSKIKNNEFRYVLVWKIDRISRNLLDFCSMYNTLKDHNCSFISKNEQFDTSSAMGEAMLKIILVFAELERKMTGERVKAIMLDRAEKGKWNGAPIPLGYQWDNNIKFPVINSDEAETVKLIYNMYKKYESTSVVRNYLNTMRIKTKRNGSWTTKTVSDIIRNPFFKGTYRYNYREQAHGKVKNKDEWIVIDNNHPAIIDNELWEHCNSIMDSNASRNSARFRDNSKIHVFASLLVCGECGSNLYAKQDKARLDGFRPSMYVCKTRYNGGYCSQKTVSEKYVGTFAFNLIKNLVSIDKRKILNENNIENIALKDVGEKNIGLTKESINNLLIAIGVKKAYAFKSSQSVSEDFKGESNVIALLDSKKRYMRAIDRLKDLFLFDDTAMSEKEFILKKKELEKKINEIDKKIKLLDQDKSSDVNFLSLASTAILQSYFKDKKCIDYNKMILETGRDILKEFTNSIFLKISIIDKHIVNIIFKNGLKLDFTYSTENK